MTSASSPSGARAGRRCIASTPKRFARFTTGAGCSRSTGADSSAASRHTQRRRQMTTTAPVSENQTFTITEEIAVRASLEQTFASLLAQMGRLNETPDGTPLPMVLEPYPGGRWYPRPRRRQRPPVGIRPEHQAAGAARDLGAAVHVDRGNLESAVPPDRDARRHADHVHAHAGRAVPGGSSAAARDRMGGAARARPQGAPKRRRNTRRTR